MNVEYQIPLSNEWTRNTNPTFKLLSNRMIDINNFIDIIVHITGETSI